MHLLSIRGWNVHVEADWNMWLIGVCWTTSGEGDIGIYFGPVSLQIEQEPRSRDIIDDA